MRELLADSTFPGMKVLQFAFSGGDNEYLPHNHVKNSVVYPGTHDNTTITAWWESAATPKEKATAAAYLHLTGVHPTAKEVAAVKRRLPAPLCCGQPWVRWPTVPSSHVRLAGSGRGSTPEHPGQAGRQLGMACSGRF